MNFDFLDRRSAERFAELLDENTGGRRHHSRGQADEQLAELVAIGNSLSGARPGVRVDSEFRTGLRSMLVATAERDGIGRTATAVEKEPAARQASTARTGLRAGLLGHGGRIRARGAIVIGVAAGAMAVSGISAASENASPGDALYGVKRSTERAQLAMAGSDVSRGQLSLDFARNRLAEAAAMKGGDSGFAGVLDDMDADTRKGVKQLTTAAVANRDAKPLTTIDGFVDRQRGMLMPKLDQLSTGNRERAGGSLQLLESVSKRSADLRAGLKCSPVASNGADTLGPKLKDCADDTDGPSSTSSRPSSGQSSKTTTKPSKDAKVSPQDADPTAEPGATAGSNKVKSNGGVTGQATPSTSPELPLGGTPVPSETPLLDPGTGTGDTTGDSTEKGPLGGLLDGIFGD
ncbi:hypothetical protein SAMN05421748_101445 [Paractinoplanes atraurantiacus]|uniref:DUF5667 domain-containing protein n=1 Tax=Paractinoplanes atraurantiacus TaxID=1036182 RepID=A0A285F213_9ACTN|nr:DUF5667 domain-containing protein [Actinoplanes atraurantiacus]SNY05335.1 hypothetical protein SAMN05421748_101445 [Actinoplanes atraurantiacus]